MSDLEARVDALERTVTESEVDLTALTAEGEALDRLDTLEDRLDEIDIRIDELEASIQAIRGYVGNVRAINQEVEQRADLALSKVQSLESASPTSVNTGQSESSTTDSSTRQSSQRGRSPEPRQYSTGEQPTTNRSAEREGVRANPQTHTQKEHAMADTTQCPHCKRDFADRESSCIDSEVSESSALSPTSQPNEGPTAGHTDPRTTADHAEPPTGQPATTPNANPETTSTRTDTTKREELGSTIDELIEPENTVDTTHPLERIRNLL